MWAFFGTQCSMLLAKKCWINTLCCWDYTLPVKAARCHCQATIFLGFESELQTNPMPFHSPWDATLIPLTACAMDSGRKKILRVGKNSGATLKLFFFFDTGVSVGRPCCLQCTCPIVYIVFCSEWVSKSSKNWRNLYSFWPPIFRTNPTFLQQIDRLAKFGWVPFADLRLQSLAMK